VIRILDIIVPMTQKKIEIKIDPEELRVYKEHIQRKLDAEKKKLPPILARIRELKELLPTI
jgi:hypothetical protein